jgi:hypothetical protein
MGVSDNPTNLNLLQANKYVLSFDRVPFAQYFCQTATLPGLISHNPEQPTPFGKKPIPANSLTYEDLIITFLVDEPLWAWTCIVDWLRGVTFPETFQQYQQLSIQQALQLNQGKPQYADAQLMIMSNKNNPIMAVNFTDIFPISISGIEFDTKKTAEDIVTATAVFRYTSYSYNRQV